MDNQPTASPQPLPEQQVAPNLAWLKTLSIGFSLVSFGIAIGVVGYFLTTKNNQSVSQNQIVSPTPLPTEILVKEGDPTINWKTYTNKNYGFSFSYPNSLEEKYGTLVTGESDGDTGKLFGGSFNKDSYPTVFSFAGTTTDFAAGREDYTTIGFEKSNNRIFYKFYTNSMDITDSVIKTFLNSNGVEVVIFNSSGLNPLFEGQIGAVINLKNTTYPGIGFTIDPERLDLKTFEQILSTFKFTNQK